MNRTAHGTDLGGGWKFTAASCAVVSLSRSSDPGPAVTALVFRPTVLNQPLQPLQPRQLRRAPRGFTLLESLVVMVVMVIIGLLAGYVGPKLFAQIGKSETKVTRAQVDALQKSLDQYRIDIGRYPATEAGLAALVLKPADEPRWPGPYLAKAVPADPWGRPYAYTSPGQHGDFDLVSYGHDGQPGGDGDNADITSW